MENLLIEKQSLAQKLKQAEKEMAGMKEDYQVKMVALQKAIGDLE